MEEFLKTIKKGCNEYTSIPLEKMVTNLIYEFPHPAEKYVVKSKFWEKYKCQSSYSFETMYSLPYCDDKLFFEFAKFQDKLLKIWSLL